MIGQPMAAYLFEDALELSLEEDFLEQELECKLIITVRDWDCNFDIVCPNPKGLTVGHV